MAHRKELVKAARRIKRKMKKLGIPRQQHDAGIIFSYTAKPIKMVKMYKRRFRVYPEYWCFLTDKKTHLYVVLGPLKSIGGSGA